MHHMLSENCLESGIPESVLKKLENKREIYEIYEIDESCDKHLGSTNSDIKVKKQGKRI